MTYSAQKFYIFPQWQMAIYNLIGLHYTTSSSKVEQVFGQCNLQSCSDFMPIIKSHNSKHYTTVLVLQIRKIVQSSSATQYKLKKKDLFIVSKMLYLHLQQLSSITNYRCLLHECNVDLSELTYLHIIVCSLFN